MNNKPEEQLPQVHKAGEHDITDAVANPTETKKEVGNGVVGAYQAIENGVVGAYKAVEDAVVGTYKKVEDFCVDHLFAREGETTEEAKKRLRGEDK